MVLRIPTLRVLPPISLTDEGEAEEKLKVPWRCVPSVLLMGPSTPPSHQPEKLGIAVLNGPFQPPPPHTPQGW